MGPNGNYNAIEVHPQLCHNQHYVDGALLGLVHFDLNVVHSLEPKLS